MFATTRFLIVDENELEDIDEALTGIDENAVDMDEIEATEDETAEAVSALAVEQNGFHDEDIEIETVMAAQVGSIQTIETKVKDKTPLAAAFVCTGFCTGRGGFRHAAALSFG